VKLQMPAQLAVINAIPQLTAQTPSHAIATAIFTLLAAEPDARPPKSLVAIMPACCPEEPIRLSDPCRPG